MRVSLVQAAALVLVVVALMSPTGVRSIAAVPLPSDGGPGAPVGGIPNHSPGPPGPPSLPRPFSGPLAPSIVPDERPPTPESIPQIFDSRSGSPSGLSTALLPASWAGLFGTSRPTPTVGYPSTPAPMGLADLGVGSSGAYSYNTTSFSASVTLSSFAAYSPGYASWLDAPDWVTLSLDTVVVNVPINGSLPALPQGTFWTENAVRFNGSELQFEDNVWNFSGPYASITPASLQNSSSLEGPSIGAGALYYQHWGPTYSVSYPFTLTLFNTLGVTSGRAVVDFNYTLSSPVTDAAGSYDQVTFNRTISASTPPRFAVSGTTTTPYGLPEDAEFVFAGDGSGSNGAVARLNGTAELRYWDSGTYVPVPSAYDYGEDSGGTSVGIAAYYGGTTEHLNAGPSLLYGLWNTSSSRLGPSANPGWIRVHVALEPEFGLLLATNASAEDQTPAGNFSFAPTTATGELVVNLPPTPLSNPYVFEGWANGFAPAEARVHDNATGDVALTLTSDASSWEAPLYFDSDGQVAAFGGSAVSGVSYSAGTLTIQNESSSLAAPFRQLNDYLFPTFDLFAATNLSHASIVLTRFIQDPDSFDFDWYGVTEWLPGITQGYYFYGGNGNYSLQNTNLTETGSESLLDPSNLLYELSPPAAEFFATNGSRAENVSSQLSDGVVVADSNVPHLAELVAFGATAVELYHTGGAQILNVSAQGIVVPPVPPGLVVAGLGVAVAESNDTDVDGVLAQGAATGIEASDCDNLTVDPISVVRGIGIEVSDSQNVTVARASVVDGFGIEGAHLQNVTLAWWNLTNGSAGQLSSGTDLWLHNLSSFSSTGLEVSDWNDLWGWNLFATGDAAVADAATAMKNVDDSSNGTFWNLTAVGGAIALWFLFYDRNFSFTDLWANLGGYDVGVLAYSTDIRVEDVHVTNESAGLEGSEFSTNIAVTNVWAATGSEGIGGTADSNVSVWSAVATSASLALILLDSQNVTARDVDASNGSVAVSLADTNNATLSNLGATNLSVGVSWGTGIDGRVSNLTASNESIGAQLSGVEDVVVSGINETNRDPGPSYFRNPFLGIDYPDAPLQTYSDQNLVLTNLTAVNCSFAFQDVYSKGLTITNIRSWESGTAVQLNGTEYATIEGVFAESDTHGLVLQSTLNITLAGSTIEDSASYAVYLVAGLNETFYANNFVANDGASAFGLYEPSHPQVGIYLAQGVNFTLDGIGNYWSDWPGGSGAYPIGLGVSDSAPAPAFLSAWLDFVGTGLTPGVRWGVAIGEHTYVASAPLIAIPSWVLSNGTFSYGVLLPPSWGAAPSSGQVSYLGANETVTIEFTLPQYALDFVESGLPSGTNWSVNVAGNAGANVTSGDSGTISFVEPNGTYSISARGIPGYEERTIAPGSEVTVLGANVTEPVAFEQVVYSLSWEESGLPLGTPWGVTVGGTFHGSNDSVVGWNASNGSYGYHLSGIPGWHEDSLSYLGNFTVSNRSQVVQIVWFPVRYSVTFAATGLPTGTSWTVVFAGQNLTLTGPNVGFDLSNGTYAFRVFATLPTTLAGTPPLGTVTISGQGATVNVSFSPSPVVPSSRAGTAFYEGVGVAAVGAGAALAVAVWAARRRPPPEEPELHGEDLPLPPSTPKADESP